MVSFCYTPFPARDSDEVRSCSIFFLRQLVDRQESEQNDELVKGVFRVLVIGEGFNPIFLY